jgi:predicted MFS family arabinose efflux permease
VDPAAPKFSTGTRVRHRYSGPPVTTPNPPINERHIIGLVGAIQFVNILDFMMVMPLGPDFAKALAIDSAQLGLVGGAYTASAAVAGFAGAFFLDKFDRRKALGLTMLGLAIGTLLGAFAWDLPSLLAARVVAGAFGGPATSLGMSIIADVIPPERRGRAMGAVMGAFSVASVLGVPAGLEMARHFGWQSPFYAVAGLGLALTALAVALLPSLTIHMQGPPRHVDVRGLFGTQRVALAYVLVALTMSSAFSMVPNFSAYLQGNLHFAREHLGILYLVGGAVSFVTMRAAGRLVDKVGSFRVGALGAALFVACVYVGFMTIPPLLPIIVVFPLFMVIQTSRNVAQQTLLTKVPRAHERAGFLSLQSAVSHLASAVGAIASSRILAPGPNDSLIGMPRLALVSISLSVLSVPVLFLVERHVRAAANDRANAVTTPSRPSPR